MHPASPTEPENAPPPPDSVPSVPSVPSASLRDDGIRETIEFLVMFLIFAFVFKTFEADVFGIPTGSMAPTLLGRHKEVTCTGCGFPYTVGASEEVDTDSGILLSRIESAGCPNCEHRDSIRTAPVFSGDRIFVNKHISDYRRYDVVVFKNPEEPHINYVKRIAGLPGETIRIRQGDIYSRKSATEPWQIQRKQDLQTYLDTQITVYDDRYPPAPLLRAGGQERWSPAINRPADVDFGGWPAAENAWTPNPQSRSYTVDAPTGPPQWLRYRHLIPTAEQWKDATARKDLKSPLLPQLVTDVNSFNSDSDAEQPHFWTSDLTLEFNLELLELRNNARLILELEDGFRTVRCELDPHSGTLTLAALAHTPLIPNIASSSTPNPDLLSPRSVLPPQPETIATGTCSINKPGSYQLSFANVDDQLSLRINGIPVPLTIQREPDTPDLNLPTDRDLAPAGIAAHGLKASLNSLVIKRDIYYRNDLVAIDSSIGITPDPYSEFYGMEYLNFVAHEVSAHRAWQLSSSVRSPDAWGKLYAELVKKQENLFGPLLEFPLAPDEYLMLGDNSPASKDGRLFDFYSRPKRGILSNRHAVRHADLIGKATFLFWPHAIPFLNNGRGYPIIGHKGDNSYPRHSFPFYPNLSRMKSIH